MSKTQLITALEWFKRELFCIPLSISNETNNNEFKKKHDLLWKEINKIDKELKTHPIYKQIEKKIAKADYGDYFAKVIFSKEEK